jgi:hypothetical protein
MQPPFMPFRLRLTIAARYANLLEKVMYCAVVTAFLLSMPLPQQPLKHAFRVCGQSHEALHPEPWMKEIQTAPPLGSVSSKLSFALILFTVYHLHHTVE